MDLGNKNNILHIIVNNVLFNVYNQDLIVVIYDKDNKVKY